MGIDKTQLRGMIRDVLYHLDPEIPYSKSAEELLMLTAATESHLGTYFLQIGGPALGIFQMEPATEACIWNNYLMYDRRGIRQKVEVLLPKNAHIRQMVHNISYQIAMCRIHYYRKPELLPGVKYNNDNTITAFSLSELARYWKKHYNTYQGKGTYDKAINDYMRLCL